MKRRIAWWVARGWALRAIVGGVALSISIACAPSSRGADTQYAKDIFRDVERRSVPPGAAGVWPLAPTTGSCAIGKEWRFESSWSRAEYGDWLHKQFLPDYTQLENAPKELAFTRYEKGDSRSVIIDAETTDSLRVRIHLCVYPD